MSERTYFSAEQEPDPDERRSGRLIPWIFVAAFVIVAAVNVTMIVFAETTFTGVTSEHPYEEGVTYNKVLAEGRREAKLGWRADVAFAAKTKDEIKLAVTLRDREGGALTGAAVAARFVRPTTIGFDYDVALTETGSGVYEAAPRLALPGQWELVITATYDGALYHKTQRVFVPE